MIEVFSGSSTEAQEASINSGKKRYEVDGTDIEVAWKEFQPSTTTQPLNPQKAVFLFSGWGYSEQTEATATVSQEFANYSHTKTYAIDTYTERGSPHSLLKEAKAAKQFIDDRGIDEKIIVGPSQGGSAGMYIAALSQDVKGLILLDSMGLYTQPLGTFIANYVKENTNQGIRPEYPPHSDVTTLKARNDRFRKEGLAEIQRQIRLAGGIHRFPQRLLSEIQQMLLVNPYAKEITAPVVIVHGAKDNLTQPKRIIPHQGEADAYIQDIHERERFLQEHLFHKSPYVRMIVAEKMGHHGLAADRPEQVARSSLYLLDRFHRTQICGGDHLLKALGSMAYYLADGATLSIDCGLCFKTCKSPGCKL